MPRIEEFVNILIIRFCAAMLVLGPAAYCAVLTNVELKGVTRPNQAMEMRPEVPGAATTMVKAHEGDCWMDDNPKGPVTAVIVRIHPNDPFVYTRKPRLVERAIDQAVNDHYRGLDQVLMFCTDTTGK